MKGGGDDMGDAEKVVLYGVAILLFAMAAKWAYEAATAKNPQTRRRDARRAWTDASVGMQLLKV